MADDAPDAYERLLDRLLASPAYGERWGRHWLDLARYADSGGFHDDLDRPHAWRYRDYVIAQLQRRQALRAVHSRAAGRRRDRAATSADALAATGFCRNGPTNDDNMGNNATEREKYRLDQLDDVISTTSAVFLGLTVGCARCHDHKFDPIPQTDYYRLLAVFDSITRKDVPLDCHGPAATGRRRAPPEGRAPAMMAVTDTGHEAADDVRAVARRL